MPDTISQDEMAANYGYALAVLKSNAELYKVFKRAIEGDGGVSWSADRFIAAVRNTKWFKQTSAAARNWFVLTKSDPASANAQIKQQQATIAAEASQLGLSLHSGAIRSIAIQSLMNGWNDQQLRAQLATSYHYSHGPQKGLAATTIEQMRQIAHDYVVPISAGQINMWTQRVIAGTATADDFKAYAIKQAKGLFPEIADNIDVGQTVNDYMDPYRQYAAETLNIDPGAVNWRSAKWQKVFKVDDTGKRSIMGLSDWQTLLRTDSTYGYDKTQAARTEAANLGGSLAQMFGVG